jgi:hypothetical protein
MLRGLHQRRSGFARGLAAFALLAIAVRALLPAGYMVAPTQDGFMSVSLCSGHQVVMNLATGEISDANGAPPAQKQQGDAPCVFATAATLAAPEVTIALPAPLARNAHVAIAAVHAAPGRGLAAPPPWSTGPPRTA